MKKKEHNKNKPSYAQCYSMNADHHFIGITVFGIVQIFFFFFSYSFLLFGSFTLWWFMIFGCYVTLSKFCFDLILRILNEIFIRQHLTSHSHIIMMRAILHTPYTFWIFTTPFFIPSLFCWHFVYFGFYCIFNASFWPRTVYFSLSQLKRWFRRSILARESRMCIIKYVVAGASGDGWCFCFHFFFFRNCFCFFFVVRSNSWLYS